MRRAIIISAIILHQLLFVVKVTFGQITIIATASAEVVEPATISGRAICNHKVKKRSGCPLESTLSREEIELNLGDVTIGSYIKSCCQLLIENVKFSKCKGKRDKQLSPSFYTSEEKRGIKINIRAKVTCDNLTTGQALGQYRVTVAYN